MWKHATIFSLSLLASALAGQAAEKIEGGAERSSEALSEASSLMLIYIVPGVRDSGGATNAGVATSVTCTNPTSAIQTINWRLLQYNGMVLADKFVTSQPRNTITASTHATAALFDDVILAPDTMVFQGSILVRSTSKNVHCTAMMLDASSNPPISSAALHMARRNPRKNSQE